ncbi:hypothetical protein SteCoe_14279 [Stentor coeruleus]|uniref:RBR-type E3 ubiquitin transferase n=1 Tax=Stentor coeruleus TaxID=5963 RepID=A0A1R2C6E5_9CILI|nr:hypothetical protein SteCoe_14279 [Stentor coeruleus]
METFLKVLKGISEVDYCELTPEYLIWYGYFLGSGNQDKLDFIEFFKNLKRIEEMGIASPYFKAFIIFESLKDKEIASSLLDTLLETCSERYVCNSLAEAQQIEYQTISDCILHVSGNERCNRENEIIIPEDNIHINYPDEGLYSYDSYVPASMKCLICLEDFTISDFIPLNTCECIFCTTCFNQHLTSQIKQRIFPIRCPQCRKELNESDISDRLDNEYRNQYFDYNFQNFVQAHSSEYSCCPTPDCKNVFIADDEAYYSCSICRKDYCLRCKVDYHHRMTCQQYQQSVIDLKTENADRNFMNFIKGTNYKQCPNCKFWVEKSSGCNHMTCRCSYQFCYACGGKYMHCECVKNARF